METLLNDPCCLVGLLGIILFGTAWLAMAALRKARRVWRRGRIGRAALEAAAAPGQNPDAGAKGRP